MTCIDMWRIKKEKEYPTSLSGLYYNKNMHYIFYLDIYCYTAKYFKVDEIAALNSSSFSSLL